ncbi:H-type lectin domain-containing protein [Streptomyces rishiriensis]|uniref:H-type lectin domain-containing protein n=1 Tax=Streptomyces rishiriensis TaxID=68264 RepID=UPI000D59C59D|nr:H-type lectin domain-containing protein [Streptomyces rishiriensis]
MATTDDYGQGVSIAALTDAPDASALARNIANAIVSRSVMRFASASARTAALSGASAPVEGMVTWLQDVDRLYRYNGSTWDPVAPQAQSGTFNVSFSGLDTYTGSAVTFPTAFSATPRVVLNINSVAGGTARWTARATSVTTSQFVPFFQSSASGATAVWSTVQIDWIALAP